MSNRRMNTEGEETALRQHAEQADERRSAAWVLLTALMQAGVGTLLHRGGAAAWWLLPLCLLPGLAVTAAARLLMALTGTPTLDEAMRAGLGRFGVAAWRGVLTLLLLFQAEHALSGLCSLYAEGVDLSVSALLLAVGTLIAALLCGGATAARRCVTLLVGIGVVMLVLVNAELAGMGQSDHFLPMNSPESPVRLMLEQSSLGWPLLLLLRQQGDKRGGRVLAAAVPTVLAMLLIGMVIFALPASLFMGGTTLADRMLLPGAFVSPIHREFLIVMWTVGLLLTVALCLWMVPEALAGQASHKTHTAIAWATAAALWATHIFGEAAILAVLSAIRPWLLLPVAALLAIGAVGALVRRAGRSAK